MSDHYIHALSWATIPPAISLLLGSFAMVFLLVMQQYAVHHNLYFKAFINALAIGALNLIAIRLGAAAGMVEGVAFIVGGALGTAISMWTISILKHRSNQQLVTCESNYL
jgi:hypothetical protein